MQYEQQQRRAIQQCPHVSLRSVTASDDTWRIEMRVAILVNYIKYRPTLSLLTLIIYTHGFVWAISL